MVKYRDIYSQCNCSLSLATWGLQMPVGLISYDILFILITIIVINIW